MIRWTNLQKSSCPKCGKKLDFSPLEEMIFCKDLNCGFQISQYRMERLVTQMNGKKVNYNAPQDNFEALQNLGMEEEKDLDGMD